jgi:hypothetical protein
MTQATHPSRILHVVLVLVATYLAAWLTLFSILTRFDYQHLLPYFAYSWSGGFELPAFVQLGAVAAAVMAAVVSGIRTATRRRSGRELEGSVVAEAGDAPVTPGT